MNAKWFSAKKAWGLLAPFLILFTILTIFGLLIAWRDVHDAATSNSTSWAAAWKASDLPSVKAFFSLDNARIILTQTVIVSIAALGMTLIIVSGGIDLSVGSGIALAAVVGAVLMQKSTSLLWVVPATVGAGTLVGLVNGTLIAAFRMAPFIVTLGMLGIGRGLAKWLAGNQTVNFPDPSIGKLMTATAGFLPLGVWIALALAILIGLVLQRTIFGRYIFAIGSNESTARLCGIRTGAMKVWIYSLAGVFTGIAGLMQMARLRQGDPTAGAGLELDIIAAVVIGGASLSGGTGGILGSMIGAVTMAVLRTGSQYMDWPNYMQEIIIGILIILAVGLDRWRQTARR